jgi:hypothetical protein
MPTVASRAPSESLLRRAFMSVRREPMEFAGLLLVIGLMGLSAVFGWRDYQLFKQEQRIALQTLAQVQAVSAEQARATIIASDEKRPDRRQELEKQIGSLAALNFCLSERLQIDPRLTYEERLALSRRLSMALPECVRLLGLSLGQVPSSVLAARPEDARLPSAGAAPDVMDLMVNPGPHVWLSDAPQRR